MSVLRQSLAEVRIHCGEWDPVDAALVEVLIPVCVNQFSTTEVSNDEPYEREEQRAFLAREAW